MKLININGQNFVLCPWLTKRENGELTAFCGDIFVSIKKHLKGNCTCPTKPFPGNMLDCFKKENRERAAAFIENYDKKQIEPVGDLLKVLLFNQGGLKCKI